MISLSSYNNSNFCSRVLKSYSYPLETATAEETRERNKFMKSTERTDLDLIMDAMSTEFCVESSSMALVQW